MARPDWNIGDQVVFGREGGEKTLGEVVGQTRGGNLKIRQLEVRGRSGNKAAGTVWTVSPALVQRAGADSETAARVEQTRVFRVGDRVAFDGRDGLVVGEVVRVNKKTLTVHAEDGTGYRVPPSLVRLRQPEDTRTEDPRAPATRTRATVHFDVTPAHVGLAFSTGARELLHGRPWVAVQSTWAQGMAAFHERTGHPIQARFATFRGLDRYNQETTLVGVWFVFPFQECTEADLTPLYDAMRASEARYTGAGLQAVPHLSFPSLVMTDGTLYQVWLQEEPEPVVMQLAWEADDASVGFVGFEAPDLGDDDFLPGIAHARVIDADGAVERT